MSLSAIIINTGDSAAQFSSELGLEGNDIKGKTVAVGNYFHSLAGGVQSADVDLAIGAVQATGSIVFTGLPSNNETVTIGNVVFTAKTSGATGAQFNIGATAAITAANLGAAINANSTLQLSVVATVVSATVFVTAAFPGKLGNAIQLSESLTNATVTAFAGGSNGTLYSLDLT